MGHVHDVLTFAFLDFTHKVGDMGPLDAENRALWQDAMKKLPACDCRRDICWAQAVGYTHCLVVIIHHHPQHGFYDPDDDNDVPDQDVIKLIACFDCLQTCLKSSPRILSVVLPGFDANKIAERKYGALDLFTVDVKIRVAYTYDPILAEWDPPTATRLNDPLLTLPFNGYSAHPSGCRQSRWGADADFKGFEVGHTLASYYKVPVKGEIKQSVCVGLWNSIDSSRIFKDSRQPSTGVENMSAAADAWERLFLRPLERLRNEGVVTGVESWTLELHSWAHPNARQKEPCSPYSPRYNEGVALEDKTHSQPGSRRCTIL